MKCNKALSVKSRPIVFKTNVIDTHLISRAAAAVVFDITIIKITITITASKVNEGSTMAILTI